MSSGISGAEKGLGRILLVDEQEHITALLKYNLENEGYDISVLPSAQRASEKDLTGYRLILADAMGQSFTGRDLTRYLKSQPLTMHIPVIIVTESDSEDDIISAFGDGADDYILKPFSLRELVARVKSVLRRNPVVVVAGGGEIKAGDLTIDLVNRLVWRGEEMLPLTKTEFAILSLLGKNKNRYFSRQEIYKEVWAENSVEDGVRKVDTNISRLRKKMGESAKNLVNKSGLGYCLQG